MNILVDTNVLLDVLEARAPHDVWSTEIWRLAETGAVTAFVAAISFNNIFYMTRKRNGSAAAMKAVVDVRSTFRTVTLDEAVLDEAIAMGAPDLEDALQAVSASRVSARFVTTRNTADFASLGVKAVAPVEFLARIAP